MGILKAIKPTKDAQEINGPAEAMTMKYTLTNLTKTYFVSQDISPLSLAPLVLMPTHALLMQPWDIHERALHVGDNFKDLWPWQGFLVLCSSQPGGQQRLIFTAF